MRSTPTSATSATFDLAHPELDIDVSDLDLSDLDLSNLTIFKLLDRFNLLNLFDTCDMCDMCDTVALCSISPSLPPSLLPG